MHKHLIHFFSFFIGFVSIFNVLSCQKIEIDSAIEEVFRESNQYGNRTAVFGGSVSLLAKPCRDYWSKALRLDITDYSKSNAGFTRESNRIYDQVLSACTKSGYSFDLYLFWCSTNDINRDPGSATDYTEYDGYDENKLQTQSGGINQCIELIYRCNPDAKIIFFTSLKQFGEYGYQTMAEIDRPYLFQHVDMQIQCCEMWGIPYLDQFYDCPFTMDNYTQYYKDLTHPNRGGYDLLKERQALFIANAY